MSKNNTKTVWALTVLLALILLFTATCNCVSSVAYAETTLSDIATQYEQCNVWNDLQGSVIGGQKFDIADYPQSSGGEPQVISFVEFGYSNLESKQSLYGLYVYVYNPQQIAFDTDTARNKISVRIGELGYRTYNLRFLNFSNVTGCEGRFYKFALVLSSSVQGEILKSLNEHSRVYEVSGITLSYKNSVTEYTVAQKYTYTGFAKGFGSELAVNDTLSCSVDGFDKYLALDVTHTFYRPQGDYYNGEQSQLNSCFFRVPNKYFEDYGELTKIVCEWFEYFTKPILITEDNYTYQKLNSLHGADTTNLSKDMYFLFEVFWENVNSSWFNKSGGFLWSSNYDFTNKKYSWALATESVSFGTGSFDGFSAVFYTGGKPAKEYGVDGGDLKQKLLANSGYLGGELLNNRYSKYLFEDYVQAGYDYGYNLKSIHADDMQEVFWNVTTKDFWQKMFGGFDVDTIYDTRKAIVTISESDLTVSNSEIASNLYINEDDVDSLKTEYAKAKANDETVVLLRYSTTQYMCAPCAVGYCSSSKIDDGKYLAGLAYDRWNDEEYNAYVAQETVYLDFDIISLWFTADDVETEIPVVMSPQDVVFDLTPPLEENYHTNGNDRFRTLKIVLAVIGGIILIVIICCVIRLILAPARAVGKTVKPAKRKNKR